MLMCLIFDVNGIPVTSGNATALVDIDIATKHLKVIKNRQFQRGLRDTFQLLDLILTTIPNNDTSSLYQSAMMFDNAYFMVSAFYPTIVTYLVHELSSAAAIHESATAIYESQREDIRSAV
ncbi:hypothetical protein H0H92_009265 [Tricholoma furcatifolium]|nr:hypothetical protein H0H92_009265 [Tricholoma furcatifolium]